MQNLTYFSGDHGFVKGDIVTIGSKCFWVTKVVNSTTIRIGRINIFITVFLAVKRFLGKLARWVSL